MGQNQNVAFKKTSIKFYIEQALKMEDELKEC